MSTFSEVQADLVAAIAAIPDLSGETIRSVYIPVFSLEKMDGREIVIYPGSRETTLTSRGCRSTTLQMQLGILEPYELEQEASQMQELHEAADAIFDGLLGERIGGTSNAYVESIEQPVVVSPEYHKEHRLAATFLTIGLRV